MLWLWLWIALLLQISNPVQVTSKPLVVFFDGGTKLNRSSGGVVWGTSTNISSLLDATWNESDISIEEGKAFYFGDVNSSLAAEFLAFIEAMHIIKSKLADEGVSQFDQVLVLGDSSNVITSLLNQQSRFTDRLISAYCCIAKCLLNSISESVPICLYHIPRDRNHLADSLCDTCLQMEQSFHASYTSTTSICDWPISREEIKHSAYSRSSKLVLFAVDSSPSLVAQSRQFDEFGLQISIPAFNATVSGDLTHQYSEIVLPVCQEKVADVTAHITLRTNNDNIESASLHTDTGTSIPISDRTVSVADVAWSRDRSVSTRVRTCMIDPAIVVSSSGSDTLHLSSYVVSASY